MSTPGGAGPPVVFEACFNFRDLGGHPTGDGGRVRPGLLFRADSLHRLTPVDAATLAGLGLRSVVDLRGPSELADFGRIPDTALAGARWHNIPMIDDIVLRPAGRRPAPAGETLGQTYARILDGRAMAEVFAVLADGLPAVVHCTGGKDRTGMVAAFALDLAGVDDGRIAADYALTEASRARSEAWVRTHEPVFAAYIASLPPDRRQSRPEDILAFLAHIRATHGSVAGFLTTHGLAPSALASLRTALVEPGPA